MTVFENFKNNNIDELAEWFDKHCVFDNAPWWNFWDEHYCKKCKPEIFTDDEGDERDFAYCEHYGNCRFFKEMKDIPDSKRIIKMWLESDGN